MHQSSRHERAIQEQQTADWNRIKKLIPDVVREVVNTAPEMVTVLFGFVSRVQSPRRTAAEKSPV